MKILRFIITLFFIIPTSQLALAEGNINKDKGFYKRLFLQNVYVVKRNWNKPNIALQRFNKKTYATTSIILGDRELGYLRSVLLRNGNSITSQAKPITLDDINGEAKSCKNIVITSSELSQTCTTLGQKRSEEKCERLDKTKYYCRVKYTDLKTKKEYHWHNLREIVKLYDLSLQ